MEDINVDSLWLIEKRDNSGKHNNKYHGNFIPQVPNQLIRRYTKENETILELFSGSGTTLFECEKLNRNYIGFDINQEIIDDVNSKMEGVNNIKFKLINCDVTNIEDFKDKFEKNIVKYNTDCVDFLILHPPYLDIVKFTDKKEDLSLISDVNLFIQKLRIALSNGLQFLKKSKYFAIVIGDVYKKSEVIPLCFNVLEDTKKHFDVKLKGIIVKNIEGNRGKLGQQNIWRYRALKSDYYIFKHEYILVFKKDF